LFSIRPFSRVLTAWPRESIWFLPTSLCSWLRSRDVARPGFSRHQGAAHFVRRFSLSFAAVRPRSQLPQADLEIAFPVETFFLFPIFGAVRLSPPIFVPAWGFLSPRELGAGPISFSCWSSRSGVASLDSYSRPRFFSHRCRSDLIFRARVSARRDPSSRARISASILLQLTRFVTSVLGFGVCHRLLLAAQIFSIFSCWLSGSVLVAVSTAAPNFHC
jgi:hypothetical protein